MSAASSAFGRRLTLGVEEELFLVDPETWDLAPCVGRILGPEGLKTELFAAVVETNTPVCESAEQVLCELRRLRRVVRDAAEREGAAVAATASHPFAIPERQEIVREPRYVKMVEEMGDAALRQLVSGLHVHVGLRSFGESLERLEAVLPWLPAVLALSLNSPYLAGAETGASSSRAGRLLELPRGGPPPPLPSEAEWERVVGATGEDYTRIWWDVRPHPRLGTLEVRMPDQPTDVTRAAALAALVQALVDAAEPAAEPLDRDEYLDRRAAAARGEAVADELLALVEPSARRLGTWDLVQELRQPPEAERQLAIGRSDGLAAVAADIVSRSG
ncbi:MAG TPA: YbdK family carboxylate-amine ligase [Gaiellaceae bacterium]|nr:YbdK family carboxylate-amine ligase [Gaiellaceae bacterium]